ELERTLDVLACGLQIAPSAIATGAPDEDVRAKLVSRKLALLDDLERLVEEVQRRLDARELVAPDADAEQHVRALDVRELRTLGQLSRVLEQLQRVAHRALAHPRRPLARERAHLQLARSRREDRSSHVLERLECLGVAPCLEQRFGARDRGVDAAALVGRDTVREEAGVDTETSRKPFDRLPRRARLAALDLAAVLLREPVSREIRLRHPRRDP